MATSRARTITACGHQPLDSAGEPSLPTGSAERCRTVCGVNPSSHQHRSDVFETVLRARRGPSRPARAQEPGCWTRSPTQNRNHVQITIQVACACGSQDHPSMHKSKPSHHLSMQTQEPPSIKKSTPPKHKHAEAHRCATGSGHTCEANAADPNEFPPSRSVRSRPSPADTSNSFAVVTTNPVPF